MKKLTTEVFIKKAKKVHGDRYNYSKTNYVNTRKKVCIICPEHGEFWQTPDNHLRGKAGCPYCWENRRGKSRSLTTNEFIKKSKELYGDKYDYSKTIYTRLKDKVCIICPEHGEFWQTARHHLNGHECKKCANIKNGKNKLKTTEDFVREAIKVHNNKYDYSNARYNGCFEKVLITCPKHGNFWQAAYCHLQGQGCPSCNNSILENKTYNALKSLNVQFIQRCDKDTFPWLGRQHLDFYLPEHELAIECQGIQHFEPIDYFGGDKKLNYVKGLDNKKKNLCLEHKIKLEYITYKEDVITKLNEILSL